MGDHPCQQGSHLNSVPCGRLAEELGEDLKVRFSRPCSQACTIIFRLFGIIMPLLAEWNSLVEAAHGECKMEAQGNSVYGGSKQI